MTIAPALTRQDVVEQLEKLYRASSSSERYLVAFHGTGTEELARTTTAGDFRIVPVRSELELRERLPPLEEEDPRVAFLVPWTEDLPLDIAGRFKRRGRVLVIGKDARLLTLFRVSEVDDAVRGSKLASYLLATLDAGALKLPSGRVTLPAVWAAWLASAWGFANDGEIALDALLAWACFDARGKQFVVAMKEPVAAGVRDELLAYLGATLGPAGAVAWRAWERDQGRVVLQFALLFHTLASSEHAGVKMWVKLAPLGPLGVTQEADMPAIAAALGAAADGAFRRIERDNRPSARQLLKAADALVENAEVKDALAQDRRLPSAWRARLDRLGAALGAIAKAPTVDGVAAAVTALRALEGHVFFADEDQTAVVKRAEMSVRLAAWLTARPDEKLEGPPTPHQDAELLGRWYADEGGYVDWARRAARGTPQPTDAFGKGAQAVVRAADAERESMDHRFARSLSSWIDAGRPSTNVVPIDHAVRRIALSFLEGNPSRRLLVLLMDGMAWAQAVELLESLGQRTTPWGPLAWHRANPHKIGGGANPPVFANLPTVTEVSRAAFFAGKAIPPGAATSTDKDPVRWAENKEVQKYLDAADAPKLLLRGESHTASGAASTEALTLVGDPSRRVVAIVVNAIDASLKADAQQTHRWKVEDIRSLGDLLEKAREADRAVLLASDHGHVPADRLESKGAVDKGGARWRAWSTADDTLGAHEVGFRGAGVYAPKGAHGVVLLADDASRYGGAAHAGEHGGATLAEVVAPCLLVGCEDVAFGKEDPGLEVRSSHVPLWWHFDLKPPVVVADPVSVTPQKPKKRVSSSQLALPAMGMPKPSVFAGSEVLGALGKSPADLVEIVSVVEFLLERNGIATDEALAAALGAKVWRIGGLVSKVAETLNVDGYPVIRRDSTQKTVHLDRAMLAQQFDVKL